MSSPSQSSSAPSPPKSQRKSRSDDNNPQNPISDEESLQVNLNSSPACSPARRALSIDLMKSPVGTKMTDLSRTPPPVHKKKAHRGGHGIDLRQRSSSYDIHSSSSNPHHSPIRHASLPVLNLDDEIGNFGRMTIHTPAPSVRRAPKRKTMDINEGATSSTASDIPLVKMQRTDFATSGTSGQGSAITSASRRVSRPRRVLHRRSLFSPKPASTSEKAAIPSGQSKNDVPSGSSNIPKTAESSPEKMDE
ncbi:hypothetical protein L5515_017899 [Caenorhabditis briggsae]|uniref:Uncharacterized protein n=1 Tax=Caenorhabditis briggsae TaxID=6238 RepID=A0AAE9FAU0_CAEBR|nr:hypothetical protein L5515_017899 [Caenorhabditis briggsae]